MTETEAAARAAVLPHMTHGRHCQPSKRVCVCESDDVLCAYRTAILGGPLFQHGDFTFHSGEHSTFKIDCDRLTAADWEAVAAWVAPKMEPFGDVIGVPTGGHAFARALRPYVTSGPSLIVDDVLTTGASMQQCRTNDAQRGLVLFARGPVPSWVRAVFYTDGGPLVTQLVEALRA